MKTVCSLEKMKSRQRPMMLAAGFFDGVHRGHQRLIKRALREREKEGGEAWVLTFDKHPMKTLHPERAPLLLTSVTHKLRLLESLGVDGCVLVPFTKSFSRLDPEQFIGMLKMSLPSLRAMFVGKNWTFGRSKRGNAAVLKKLCRRYGFNVKIVPPLCWKGSPISSTRIRMKIKAGMIDSAAEMLGRPASILGSVAKGSGTGRRIGIPTANLDPHNEVYPPDGVYVARSFIAGKKHDGILNLGTRPTVSTMRSKAPARRTTRCRRPVQRLVKPKRVLELHIFDARPNLYGKEIEVSFLKKLRNERRFASMEDLKRQIENDIRAARAWLARHDSARRAKKT